MTLERPRLEERALAAPPRLGRTRLVAVDGPAGSGKTTLAARLAAAFAQVQIEATVLHMDDVYEGWTGLDEALEHRVLTQVLHPLASAEPARWQRYDWHRGQFDDWQVTAPTDVLVLEGCGAGARAYAAYISLLVWVEAAPQTRVARGVARDGEQVLGHWLPWMELEEAYFAANDTRERADVRLRT